jgi:hypothetical protein
VIANTLLHQQARDFAIGIANEKSVFSYYYFVAFRLSVHYVG